MRISGNYFERLFFNVLPWTLLATLIIYLTEKNNKEIIFAFLALTISLWFFDTTIIFVKFKNPKSLRVTDKLIWGQREILLDEIYKIIPVVDRRFRWTFKMVQFSLSDGTTFFIIDKSQNFVANLFDRQSKTVTLLLKEFPDFWSKLESPKYI